MKIDCRSKEVWSRSVLGPFWAAGGGAQVRFHSQLHLTYQREKVENTGQCFQNMVRGVVCCGWCVVGGHGVSQWGQQLDTIGSKSGEHRSKIYENPVYQPLRTFFLGAGGAKGGHQASMVNRRIAPKSFV